jgi:hypothetical protein
MHTKNGSLHVALTIPEEELNKAIQEQRGALQTAVMSQLPVEISSKLSRDSAPQWSRRAAGPDGKIVKNAQGETLVVTLPGKR